MHEQAAEDVSRLLDKPGLRQVVQVAEQVRAQAAELAPPVHHPEPEPHEE
jgi:hypothetical protein